MRTKVAINLWNLIQMTKKKNKKTCPFCFKIFHSQLNMKRHKKTHHDGSMRQKCSDCGKTYASKTALNYHKKMNHEEDTMVTCNDCEKQFTNLKALKVHEKSHNTAGKQKIIKCCDCNKTFSSSSNLREARSRSPLHHQYKPANVGERKAGALESETIQLF